MQPCFVLQGDGPDRRVARVIDRGGSCEIIKDAVEGTGLECIRVDEIPRSGTIDLPMYEWLFKAGLVVADRAPKTSTRHSNWACATASAHDATINVAEDQVLNPFDQRVEIRRLDMRHRADAGQQIAPAAGRRCLAFGAILRPRHGRIEQANARPSHR